MTLTQFINYINYSTIRPDRVSVVRWDAMIKYAKVNGIISWIAIDKLIKIVYNTDMTNNNNTNERRNEMIEKLEVTLIVGSGIVAVVACAIVSTWILLNTL